VADSALGWADSAFRLADSGRRFADSSLGLEEPNSRGLGESARCAGESAPGIAELTPGMGDSATDWANGPGVETGVVPGPVEAHADEFSTAASKHNSSALLRRLAGNMALLREDVRQYCPCQRLSQVF
jgi:hypothetical protein